MTPETKALLAQLLDEIRGLAAPMHPTARFTASAVLEALRHEGVLTADEYRDWGGLVSLAESRSVERFVLDEVGGPIRRSMSVRVGPKPSRSSKVAVPVGQSTVGGATIVLTRVDANDEGLTLHWRADDLDTDLLFPGLFAESEEAWLGLEHLDQISRQRAMNKLDAMSPEIREALARMHSPLSGRGWPSTRLHALYSMWKYSRITDESEVAYSVGASQVSTNTNEASGPQKYTGSFEVMPQVADRVTNLELTMFGVTQDFRLEDAPTRPPSDWPLPRSGTGGS